MKAVGLLLTLLLLLLPAVIAEVEYSQFDSWLTSQQVACQCDVFETTINIFNTGSDNTFTIAYSGSAKEWTSIGKNYIFLKKGEQRLVPIYINIPCSANSADISIKVETINGISKELHQELPIAQCGNLQIEANQQSQTSNPCRPLAYSFDVFNSGNFQETYNFKTTKFQDQTLFMPQAITLGAKSTATITAIVTPSCDVYGDHQFNFIIDAVGNDLQTSIPISASINRDYDFSLQAGSFDLENYEPQTSPYQACINENHALPIKITNEGSVENTYDLDVKGAKLSEYVVTIPAKSSKLIGLAFFEKKVQQKYITIEASTRLGNLDQAIALPVNIENCYDASIHTPNKVYVNESSLTIALSNDGTRELTANYALVGSDLLSLENSSDTFTNQSTVSIAAALPFTGIEKATFYAQLNNGDVISKNITFVFGKPFWDTYGECVLLVLLVILLIVAAIILHKKHYYKPKRKVKKHSKRVKKALEDVKKEKSVTPKSNNLAWLIPGSIIILLLLVFFLPISTLQSNASNATDGTQEFEVDNALRLNLRDIVNSSYYGLMANPELNLDVKDTYVYISAPNTTETTLTILLNGSEKLLPIIVTQSSNETAIEHGVDVYKTLAVTSYDAVLYTNARYYLFTALLILVVIIVAIVSTKKNKKSDKQKTKRFELLK